ncbi:MAG: CsgG/HfaB family protein [Spirochaetes bacterium]|nr:CsgG/HfaB family protein [Spirochaetota bacterium]
MKISRKIVLLIATLVVASCATNREIVRRNAKELLQKYRGETNQKIAIIPFMTKSQQKNPELEAFDDEIMDVVFEDKRFQIVERSLIEQITKEWTFSESGLVDEEQRSKIGKLSGAKLILVPIVSGEKNINMRIISVNTGDVLSYVRANLAAPIAMGMGEVPRTTPTRKVTPGISTPSSVPGGGSIAVGAAVNGAITQAGGRDNYTLNIHTPKTVEIRADKTDSSFDPYLELYNNAGQMIAQDDDSGGSLNAKIVTGLAPGVYTVVVRAYNQNILGNYRLSVSEAITQAPQYMGGSAGGLSSFAELLIQLETSVNFSAQSSEWRNRRSSWLSEVRSAGSSNNFHRMKDLVLEFERNILTTAQNSNWLSNSRNSWVQRVRNAQSLRDLATLVIECESNILYSAQASTWRNSRSGWISQMQSLR